MKYVFTIIGVLLLSSGIWLMQFANQSKDTTYNNVGIIVLGLGITCTIFSVLLIYTPIASEIKSNVEEDDNELPNLEKARIRLVNEIELLRAQGKISLWLGIGFGIGGIVYFLLLSLFFKDIEKPELRILSNTTTIFFLELICLFFLNNFKNINRSIQYYHNEITNIQNKETIMHLLKENNPSNTLNDVHKIVVEQFIKDDRNSTKSEIDDKDIDKYLNFLSGIQKLISPK